ncbi:hypothetical protein QYF61_027412 [Mycteria americana]|uniref:Endonuclease/exonuclease/phosphatase domain-containing protein n=1 Tax=Mycteria americana TaxID=33587 RepID=A0AAN7SAI0_MYCAM|nr:hypothetical protein QYF61_027412 [Mycteria americana]
MMERGLVSSSASSFNTLGLNKPSSLNSAFPHTSYASVPLTLLVTHSWAHSSYTTQYALTIPCCKAKYEGKLRVSSTGNKQEELEAIMQLENYDIVAIMETWWDDLHNWSAAMDSYKLFRRDKQGRRGGGVALYVRECFDCLELNDGDDRVECLRMSAGNTIQQRKQPRRFLECVEDNFLTQLASGPTRKGAPLDLLFANKEELVVTKDEEKAEVLSAFYASVFNSQTSCSRGILPTELEDRDREQNEAPIIQGEMVSDLLHHLDTHRSMGPDGIHPRVLRELAEVLTKPLSIVYQQSWLTGEVPVDCRLANVIPIYKKGQNED